MHEPTRSVIPAYLPSIYDPTRPDDDPEHSDHWAIAWTRALGFHLGAGLRNDRGDHLTDVLELQVAERTILRRERGRIAGELRPAYVFLDGSGIVLPDAGRWLPVSPDGTTRAGRCDWLRDD